MIKFSRQIGLSLVLTLVLGAIAFSQSILYFPRMVHDPGAYTGFAILNPTDEFATITLTAFDEGGRQVQSADVRNPVTVTLAARSQASYLDWEIFDFPVPVSGWVQGTSPTGGLIGSFLFGDTQGAALDGADTPIPSTQLVFPCVIQDGGSLTEISVINPGPEPAEVSLRLYDTQGQMLGSQGLTLGAHSVHRDIVQTLFPSVSNFSWSGHILAAGKNPIIGFEVVRLTNSSDRRRRKPSDVIGLNAIPLVNAGRVLYFPHLISGHEYFASIVIINLSEAPQQVTLTAVRSDGRPYSGESITNPRTVLLPPLGVLRETAQSLFGLPAATLSIGWLRAEAQDGPLAGFIVYGHSASDSRALATAQTRGLELAAYSQVSHAAGYYTGLVLLNPGDRAARVEVISLRADGTPVGIFRKELKPEQSLAKLLHELVRDAQGQMQGSLIIRCDRPIISTQVMGSQNGWVLVNLPPQTIARTAGLEERTDVWIDTDLGDDILWRQQTFSELAGGRQLVNVLVAPPTAILAPRSSGARRTSVAAEEEGAKAAVNGGSFSSDASLPSLSLLKVDGEQLADNAAHRSVFAILETHNGERTITTIAPGALYEEAYQALGGGPRLIVNGKMFIPYQAEGFSASFTYDRHPRTGLGLDLDGTVYLVTVDGSGAGGSTGMSLPSFAQFLLDLGAFQALNLEGGGSTTMWINDYGVVNYPADGAEARVSTIMLVW